MRNDSAKLEAACRGNRMGATPFRMDLEDFRLSMGMSYAELAAYLGWSDAGYTRRVALGEYQPSTAKMAGIEQVTARAVSPAAMFQRRVAWLKVNRPEKLRRSTKRNPCAS